MREGRTSPLLATMTFAGPSRQVHGTRPISANGEAFLQVRSLCVCENRIIYVIITLCHTCVIAIIIIISVLPVFD